MNSHIARSYIKNQCKNNIRIKGSTHNRGISSRSRVINQENSKGVNNVNVNVDNNSNVNSNNVNNRGPVTYMSLFLIAIVGGGTMFYYQIEKEKKVQRAAKEIKTTGKAALGGPWSLVDSNGIPRTDAHYKGQYHLLYFGFTYCPDICPSELVKIGKIIDEVKRKGMNIVPIFISVDPARDSIRQLNEYSKDFHKDFHFLTGTKDQIATATKAYRVYFSKANEHESDDEDYLVDHSIVMYFLSPSGEFLDFFTQRMTVSDVVDRILKQQTKQ
jgi:protein SCO1/2